MGTIDARFQVQHGKISAARFYGDFFGPQDVSELEQKLIGINYDYDSLKAVFENSDLSNYFTGINPADILQLVQP